jgi:hypothetical protein
VLAPHEACRPTKHREIHQLDHRTILDHRRRFTLLAIWPNIAGLDIDPDRLASHIINAHDVHDTKANKQLTHHSKANFHRGSPF